MAGFRYDGEDSEYAPWADDPYPPPSEPGALTAVIGDFLDRAEAGQAA